ncbi:DUF2303 family protein [Vibrio parahaemolyticus]|uniref:DUF2303 family protein n=1 Tax=Vibrio TaxID=662 RepID=UPI00038E3234|nr:MULTISPECIES: DUF2303 family protein [Vibrio]EKP4439947.1 DUF2303 family protein [Vibrio alginolyticus]ETZ09022.1 hypothetical protein AJ90_07650 [Vibrio parahaemolyticus M0605]EGQ7752039.1 DUF2303 family protein [Vibrio parahaemolyticus]EGQ7811299.1 DUF2303 family protein [Vibrio parahaemolyticus]EGQ9814440.1 DUF2303 family protein [Vibrio parahaemolyticus]
MSFTKESIQELVNKGSVPEFIKAIEAKNTLSQLILVPDNCSLKDLEQYQEHRNNLRGEFNTISITEFAKYAKDHQLEGSKTFIDADSMKAKTIFDVGTNDKAGHQLHKASVSLKRTAPFKALLNIDGERMEQRDMAEFLEDWKDYISAFDSNGEQIEMFKAIAAVRELDFEHTRGSNRQVSDFSQSQSEYERIATKTREDLVLPAAFVFTCEPYSGLGDFRFELRLSIIRNELLTLRIKRMEEIQEQMAEKFLEVVKEEFANQSVAMPTYIGTY